MNKITLFGYCINVGNIVATFAGWLPPIAAALSIIYTSLMIYQWWKKRGD